MKSLEKTHRRPEQFHAAALDPESRLGFLIAVEEAIGRLDPIRQTTGL